MGIWELRRQPIYSHSSKKWKDCMAGISILFQASEVLENNIYTSKRCQNQN